MRIAKHRLRRLFVFALLLLANQAYAYDAPGHFYTVTYALEELDAPTASWDSDRKVIAFCSWLPDASVELSATSVLTAAASSYSMATGADIGGWLAFKMLVAHPLGAYGIIGCPLYSDPDRIDFDPPTMQPVVIVQQFIHGLTGGDPKTVTSVALDLPQACGARRNKKLTMRSAPTYCAQPASQCTCLAIRTRIDISWTRTITPKKLRCTRRDADTRVHQIRDTDRITRSTLAKDGQTGKSILTISGKCSKANTKRTPRAGSAACRSHYRALTRTNFFRKTPCGDTLRTPWRSRRMTVKSLATCAARISA